MNADGQEQQELTPDEIMEQQAKMMEAKLKAGVAKKPLIQKKKVAFDSADYFKDKEQQKDGDGN